MVFHFVYINCLMWFSISCILTALCGFLFCVYWLPYVVFYYFFWGVYYCVGGVCVCLACTNYINSMRFHKKLLPPGVEYWIGCVCVYDIFFLCISCVSNVPYVVFTKKNKKIKIHTFHVIWSILFWTALCGLPHKAIYHIR